MPQPAAQDELVEIADQFRTRFESPVEGPEPAPRLGLEARAGQPLRQFKHLHQMCLGHAQYFEFSAALKLLALPDG